MAVSGTPWGRSALALAGAGLLIGVLGCGGNKSEPPAANSETTAAPAVIAPPTTTATEQQAKGPDTPSAPVVDPRWGVSFQDACRVLPPANAERPPDVTITGKSVGVLYQDVERLWNTIPLVSPEGKPLVYHVTLDTEQGPIDLDLHAAWAPNHVRSFLALVKAGYYNGLLFERCVHQVSEDPNIPNVDLIEGGCPLGSGEVGQGSIGYWLRAEVNPEIKNEEGMVGACRLMDDDSDTCRFYVALAKAPTLDGSYSVFGKVTKGLDVARKIWEEGVRGGDDATPPVKRTMIRMVTIHAAEVDKAAVVEENKK